MSCMKYTVFLFLPQALNEKRVIKSARSSRMMPPPHAIFIRIIYVWVFVLVSSQKEIDMGPQYSRTSTKSAKWPKQQKQKSRISSHSSDFFFPLNSQVDSSAIYTFGWDFICHFARACVCVCECALQKNCISRHDTNDHTTRFLVANFLQSFIENLRNTRTKQQKQNEEKINWEQHNKNERIF